MYISTYISTHLSTHLSTFISTYTSTHLSTYLSINLHTNPSINLYINPSINLYINLSYINLCFYHPKMTIDMLLPFYLSIFLSFYLSIFLSISIYLSIYMYIYWWVLTYYRLQTPHTTTNIRKHRVSQNQFKGIILLDLEYLTSFLRLRFGFVHTINTYALMGFNCFTFEKKSVKIAYFCYLKSFLIYYIIVDKLDI